MKFETLDALLASMKTLPGDCEGYVVSFEDGFRFKIKGEEYLKIVKAKGGYTEKKIESILVKSENGLPSLKKVLEPVPEEFHECVTRYYNYYTKEMTRIAQQTISQSIELLQLGLTKKEMGQLKKNRFKHEKITMKIDFPCESMISSTCKKLKEHDTQNNTNILERLHFLGKRETTNDSYATSEKKQLRKDMMKILFNNRQWRGMVWSFAKKAQMVKQYKEGKK